jgi:hypothetical protein
VPKHSSHGPSTIPLRHLDATPADDAEEWWSFDHSAASSRSEQRPQGVVNELDGRVF